MDTQDKRQMYMVVRKTGSNVPDGDEPMTFIYETEEEAREKLGEMNSLYPNCFVALKVEENQGAIDSPILNAQGQTIENRLNIIEKL